MALTKSAQVVFHPAVAARSHRPYSRTCPTPPPPIPPKRWITKTVCGTYAKYAFYATTATGETVQVTQFIYNFGDAYPTQITESPAYDPSKPFTQPAQIGFGPYCMKVRVYE